MSIFLDTCLIGLIKRYHKMGIVDGVTTNPSIMIKDGITGGIDGMKKRLLEIEEIIERKPISVEVTTNIPKDMVKQAKEFHEWSPFFNIKIPIHGPHGGLDNLEIIHQFEHQEYTRINATAIMSAQQGFLAAKAGATYVSIFAGRISDMGYDAIAEITRLRTLIDDFELQSQIIACSVRGVGNVMDWLEAGAHIVTVPPEILGKMIVHPRTKETVQQFLKDGIELENQRSDHEE